MDALQELDELERAWNEHRIREASAMFQEAGRIWTAAAFARFMLLSAAAVALMMALATIVFAAAPNVVQVARSYVGEGNVFNDDGANYCADFVVRVFGDQLPVPPSRSAKALWNAIQATGLATDDPQPGDLVFFWRVSPQDWRGHVGIVVVRQGRFIGTVEGNVGGKVVMRRYVLGEITQLLGFGRTGERG